MPFKNKNIVITGGTSGIGLALAMTLFKKGANLFIVARNKEKLESIYHYFQGKINTKSIDMSKREEIDQLFKALYTKNENWSGKVDIFISNAGLCYYEEAGKESWDHIKHIYDLNVLAPIYSLSKMLKHSKKFHFVVTASAVADFPTPGYCLYSSTKSAISTYMKSFVNERKYKSIDVSIVYPIAIKTPFYKHYPLDYNCPVARQSMKKCVSEIVKGMEKKQKIIYTSKALRVGSMIIPKPLIMIPQVLIENYRLKKWVLKLRELQESKREI